MNTRCNPKRATLFLSGYLFLLILGVSYWYSHQHGDFVLLLNDIHQPVLDVFFKWITYLGDEIFIISLVLFLIVFQRNYGLILGLASITQGLIQLVFKQIIFKDTPRPSVYFEERGILHSIEGVELSSFHSFPSGHTITAFVIATFFVMLYPKFKYQLSLLLMATIVAISRVYLAQHFLIDIMFGSLIGIVVGTLFYVVFCDYLQIQRKD